MRTHKDLVVWQKAIDLVLDIYNMTKSFPKEEVYGLVSQMRRAAVSIPANIAEGAARQTKKEFQQFVYISMGSLAELETHLILSVRLSFCGKQEADSTLLKLDEIRRMLSGLLNHFRHNSRK
ncbi:MAG TPA: four helix bundle protein [Paludibacter sp.]|nr:four helix bundle protein [Paludibacter sp.]